MKPLYVAIHPDIKPLNQQRIMQRKAARAIAMRGERILLLYTLSVTTIILCPVVD